MSQQHREPATFYEVQRIHGGRYIEGSIDRFIPGDIVVPPRLADTPRDDFRYRVSGVVVTGLGDPFERQIENGTVVLRRYYVMALMDWDKLSKRQRDALPKSAAEVAESRKKLAIAMTAATRKAAKAMGGKALTGTERQKSWGEEIRSKFLLHATPDQAEKMLAAPAAQKASFWIENKNSLANPYLSRDRRDANIASLVGA